MQKDKIRKYDEIFVDTDVIIGGEVRHATAKELAKLTRENDKTLSPSEEIRAQGEKGMRRIFLNLPKA